MDFIRRFFSFVNRPGETIDVTTTSAVTVPGYYLGHTYAAQPNSDELRRAAHILTSKTKKDLDKNALPMLSINFEGTMVVLRDGKHHKCCEYDIRRIVVSCVDAKNQKLLAIFYHNESPYIASPMTTRGLECHLFLCRNKDMSKLAANKIGELLSQEYKQPTRTSITLQEGNLRYSKSFNHNEFDYANVSKFFQQNVFNNSSQNRGPSRFSTPSSSLSTFVTTTCCDSGRASTIASLDIKPEDPYNGFQEPIYEHDNESDSQNINRNSIFQNRYSVHYDLEDQPPPQLPPRASNKNDPIETDQSSINLTNDPHPPPYPRGSVSNTKDITNQDSLKRTRDLSMSEEPPPYPTRDVKVDLETFDDDIYTNNGLKTPELQRLLDMGETNI